MHELSVATAWDVLRHCARIAREIRVPGSFAWRDGQLMPLDTGVPSTHGAIVHWDGVGRWSCVGQFSDATADFLELYLNLERNYL